MQLVQAFIVAFVFSYIGSIPPGTINLSVIQLSLQGKGRSALNFALAAAFIEFFYASFAVGIEYFFLSKVDLTMHFKVIAGMAMIVLGVVNYFKKPTPASAGSTTNFHGFKQGTIVSIFNPLAIPFWIAITAYLKSHQWVVINSNTFIFYIVGISTGTFALLASLSYLVSISNFQLEKHHLINKIMGIIFILLGLYTFLTL